VLVALSAASFGTMPIFAVWAYEEGASTWALLTVRFGLAGLVLAAVLRVRRIPLPPMRRCLPLAAMGVGYVGQSACYFTALHYAQASLVSLLLYLFPAFVAVLAALFLGERLRVSVAMAIAMSVAGTALLVGGGSGRPLGIALGVGAALIYSVYITVGTVVTAGVHPLAVTTVVSTSAAFMSGFVALTQATRGHAPSFPESAHNLGDPFEAPRGNAARRGVPHRSGAPRSALTGRR
jgi:drug/metabolite transporter (DMT)-like permease